MLKETGLVTKIEGDLAWVNTQSKLTCSSCQVESTCGNAILDKYLAGKVFISKVKNTLSAQIGDQVEISIPKASITKASLLVYWFPLFSLMVGALLGDYLFKTEVATIFTSFVGLAFSYFVIKFYNNHIMNNEIFQPKMLSKSPTNYNLEPFNLIKIKNI